jgi:dolichol-phosphate mannosyltransferase
MILNAVVPTYNEVGHFAQLAADLLSLELPSLELRLTVVDDASPDGTGRLADDLAERNPHRVTVIHRQSKQGLGSAYITGFAQAVSAGAALIAQLDADRSHDPAVLLAMVEAIGDGDLVIGSRYLDGGDIDDQWAWYRRLLSRLANRVVVPALLSLPLTDATSGYRLWRRSALARIAPAVNVRSSGYGFQVEMAYLAHRLGCRIREVPISFRERESGESKMSAMAAFAAVREILAIRGEHAETLRLAARDPGNW